MTIKTPGDDDIPTIVKKPKAEKIQHEPKPDVPHQPLILEEQPPKKAQAPIPKWELREDGWHEVYE